MEVQTAPVPELSWDALLRRLRDPSVVLVDALPPESYANGHIPGARSLPVSDVKARAHEVLPDKGAEVVVYCAADT